MTKLSPDHKPIEVEDRSVERLLLLDGEIMEVGGGYWVKFTAHAVTKTTAKPHGVDYALCLFNAEGERVVSYDNAHPITVGSGPARKRTERHDHRHKGKALRPYVYVSAETLLHDFWTDVDEILKRSGV